MKRKLTLKELYKLAKGEGKACCSEENKDITKPTEDEAKSPVANCCKSASR